MKVNAALQPLSRSSVVGRALEGVDAWMRG